MEVAKGGRSVWIKNSIEKGNLRIKFFLFPSYLLKYVMSFSEIAPIIRSRQTVYRGDGAGLYKKNQSNPYFVFAIPIKKRCGR
jgi:hypothetical protein